MPRRLYLLLTLTLLVGAFLRLWQLTAIPPGLHYDLAATALLGNDVAFNGYRPIFITAYTGHEVLFYYWLALWFRLVGSSVFTLRLAAATLGLLTLPAVYFAIRQVVRFEENSRLLAVFAAAFLAFSFFHVAFSRFGFRVVAEPLVQSLALGFLFRGLHRSVESQKDASRWQVASDSRRAKAPPSPDDAFALRRQERGRGGEVWDFALAGVFTGLAAYTYLAARLFPFPLAIFWLALLLGAIRSTLHASRFTLHAPRFTLHASRFIAQHPFGTLHAPRSTLHAPPSTLHASSRSTPFVIWSFGFLVFFLSALLAFAPLGLYFLRHPADFLIRASQVTPRPGEAALLLQGIRRAAEMIFLNGDPYDRLNLPGLPLFSPVLGFFFVIGLLITLYNLFRPHTFTPTHPHTHTLSRATELMLIAWLPLMLLPTALSVHDVFPSNLRAFGLIPLLFVFPARGLLAGYRWLQSRLPGPLIPSPYPLTLVCLAALAIGGYATYRDYFISWANLPDQRLNDDADLAAIAGYLNAQDLADTEVFVSAIHYRHPTLAYLAHNYLSIRWFTGGTSLAIPENRAALYLFARSAPPPEEWIAAWSSHLVAAPVPMSASGGVPDFRAYRFAAGETPPLPEFTSLDENFGNAITLTGYRLTSDAPPSTLHAPPSTPDAPPSTLHASGLTLDLRWHVENTVEIADLIPYARLYDAWGTAWSQSGGFTYPSEQWSPGDTLLTRVTVPLPAGLPPGDYTLKAGMYSEKSQSSLPHLDAQGGYAGDRAALGGVTLPGGPSVALEDFIAQNPMTVPASNLDPGSPLALLGYTLNTPTPRQGERVLLTLFWRARAPLAAHSLTLSLGGQSLFTGQPVHDTFPFSNWPTDALITDRYALKVPPDFPSGPAGLALTVSGIGSAALTSLDVTRVDRIFTAPAPATPVEYDFNHEITLRGYDLQPGPSTSLTLDWQPLISDLDDYTVFVHVLDSSGQIAAQADSQPRNCMGALCTGTPSCVPCVSYPTSIWVRGEYISDPYTFNLAPGTYTLELGLYLPETGARLPVFDSSGDPLGTSITLLPFEIP